MNGVMIFSDRWGPIIARTTYRGVLRLRAPPPSRRLARDSAKAEPTATVDGTSMSTAKKAISAACPVVRCAVEARAMLDQEPPRGAPATAPDLSSAQRSWPDR